MERFEAGVPVVRQVEIQRPVVDDILTVQILQEAPSEEQARAVDQVFTERQQHSDLGSLLALASAGMLVHDIVKDTLAPPANDDEEKDEGDGEDCPQ